MFSIVSARPATIVKQASRLPAPFVFFVRNRTVANVDSIGFVVRMCIPYGATKRPRRV